MCKAQPIPRIICTDPTLGTRLRHWLAEQPASGEVICAPADCSEAPLCGWLKPPTGLSDSAVQAALLDAVATLARTRHAFKSRELAELRTRLERLLEELSDKDEIG